MIVYKITNNITGKSYIGQTRQKLETRWRQHQRPSSNCSLLSRSIRKHGADAFTVTAVATGTCQAELDAVESSLIQAHNTLAPNGYNLTTGGEGGYTRSEQTKELLSAANKGKRRPHSEESKRKLSAKRMGALNPMYGRVQSEETKRKRSEALKGRKRSPETIAKIKASHNPKSDLNLTYRRHEAA